MHCNSYILLNDAQNFGELFCYFNLNILFILVLIQFSFLRFFHFQLIFFIGVKALFFSLGKMCETDTALQIKL